MACRGPNTPGSAARAPLRVRFLGVGGFLVERGNDAVLTAPLFTRPSWIDVTTGSVSSNGMLVDRHLPPGSLANVRAVVAGHAHYDHLLDVPTILAHAPQATLYANRSAKNLLASFAPNRASRCAGAPPPPVVIPRNRVVALDDPAASAVDYTFCPQRRPPNAPTTGRWVPVPGSWVRIFAVCSEHPDQLGPIHYAPGGLEEEACTPPARAADWLEGTTLAYLIDFLDPRSGAPVYRVYYQDAPTNAPAGLVPEPLLREKRIDVALLCVGAFERVANAPAQTLAALSPRYALGGHWEDFSRPAELPAQPIPLLDLPTWVARARFALPPTGDRPLVQNGAALPERFAIPRPNDVYEMVP